VMKHILLSVFLVSFSFEVNAGSRIDSIKNLALYVKDFHSFSQKRYEEQGEQIYQKLTALGTSYLPLLADPGIAVHVDDFSKFVLAKGLKNGDPWEARRLFSEHLGKTIVFRGMSLVPRDIEYIAKNG